MRQSKYLSPANAIARHVVLLMSGALVMIPLVWMISLSLKPPSEIFQGSFNILPKDWYAVENYTRALTAAPLPHYLLNGVVMCLSILLLQIAICAPCAYALAKLEFRGKVLIFGLVLVGLLIPPQVLALPLFIMGYQAGLLNTFAALVIPFVVSPFGIFLFRQFFKTIPDDVVHAARLDGLSEIAIIWRIMIPMAKPAVIAFSIFSVVGHWNDLFWPLIAVRDQNLMPPVLGIIAFRNDEAGSEFGPLMAASTIVIAPLILAFLSAQKYFTEGLAAGSVR